MIAGFIAISAVVYKYRAEASYVADVPVRIPAAASAIRQIAVPAVTPTPIVIIRYVTRREPVNAAPALSPFPLATGVPGASASATPATTAHPGVVRSKRVEETPGAPEIPFVAKSLAQSYSRVEAPVVALPEAAEPRVNFTAMPAPSVSPSLTPVSVAHLAPAPKKRTIWKHSGIFGHP